MPIFAHDAARTEPQVKPMNESADTRQYLGPIRLAAGEKRSQVFVYLSVVMPAAWITSFFNLMQPLLINEQLGVPAGDQGMLAGLLGSTQQGAFLILISLAGAFADQYGRRTALIIALLGFALCAVLYPLASVVWMLFVVRFLQGASQTGFTAGGATKIMDYPDNDSRGKFVSLIFFCNSGSTAIVVALITSRMPSWFRNAGFPAAEATRYSFWIMAVIALAGAASAFFFLEKDSQRHRAAKGHGQPQTLSVTRKRGNLAETLSRLREVVAHARRNPRFAVVLLLGAVIRTDSVIMGTFLGLWIVNAAKLRGMDAIEATKTIGLLTGIMSVSSFIIPPLFGILADRMNRLKLLLISMGATALGFGAIGLIENVFGLAIIAVIIGIGIAEGAQTISAQSLFAEEAPAHLRGSAMGLFVFLGTSSVVLINLLGGYLFDAVGFTAPFVMEGLLNLVFLILALLMIKGQRGKLAAEQDAAARTPNDGA